MAVALPDPVVHSFESAQRNFEALASAHMAINLVTVLPALPFDGRTVVYEADSTNHIYWSLRYHAAEAKWNFLGGPPLYANIDAAETRVVGAYAALATAGPSITVPLAGDYIVQVGSLIDFTGFHSYDVDATAATDVDSAQAAAAGGGSASAVSVPRTKTGLAASAAIRSKYKAATNTVAFQNRWMTVLPVRVS